MRHANRRRQSNTLRSTLAAYGTPEAPSREHIEYVTTAMLACAPTEYSLLGNSNVTNEQRPVLIRRILQHLEDKDELLDVAE